MYLYIESLCLCKCVFISSQSLLLRNPQRVKETSSDGTDIHELTLEDFLCSEEDKHQALDIFGKRFVNVLTCSRLMMVICSRFSLQIV